MSTNEARAPVASLHRPQHELAVPRLFHLDVAEAGISRLLLDILSAHGADGRSEDAAARLQRGKDGGERSVRVLDLVHAHAPPGKVHRGLTEGQLLGICPQQQQALVRARALSLREHAGHLQLPPVHVEGESPLEAPAPQEASCHVAVPAAYVDDSAATHCVLAVLPEVAHGLFKVFFALVSALPLVPPIPLGCCAIQSPPWPRIIRLGFLVAIDVHA
mmetsp:Transcript_2607/g.7884  ORF Transcript_2607/g.7884 Transcript_2607/m.7884 type:complete len:218 (-) Transcript_2607:449-1102(-)